MTLKYKNTKDYIYFASLYQKSRWNVLSADKTYWQNDSKVSIITYEGQFLLVSSNFCEHEAVINFTG